jgi:hypothetical protein
MRRVGAQGDAAATKSSLGRVFTEEICGGSNRPYTPYMRAPNHLLITRPADVPCAPQLRSLPPLTLRCRVPPQEAWRAAGKRCPGCFWNGFQVSSPARRHKPFPMVSFEVPSSASVVPRAFQYWGGKGMLVGPQGFEPWTNGL